MIRDRDIRQLQKILLIRRLLVYLFISKYLDRITKATYSDNSYTEYFYDAVGRLTTVTVTVTDTGMIGYVYSDTSCSTGCGRGAADKVVREITPRGVINYEYDVIGRRTKMTVAGQEAVSYNYDNIRLTEISSNIGNFGFSYDSLGRRTSVTRPNGVTTNYTYDSANRLLELIHQTPTQIVEKLTYEYDVNGNRMNMNRMNVATKPSTARNEYYI